MRLTVEIGDGGFVVADKLHPQIDRRSGFRAEYIGFGRGDKLLVDGVESVHVFGVGIQLLALAEYPLRERLLKLFGRELDAVIVDDVAERTAESGLVEHLIVLGLRLQADPHIQRMLHLHIEGHFMPGGSSTGCGSMAIVGAGPVGCVVVNL